MCKVSFFFLSHYTNEQVKMNQKIILKKKKDYSAIGLKVIHSSWDCQCWQCFCLFPEAEYI